MKEPTFVNVETGERLAYSQAPTWMLQHSGEIAPLGNAPHDADFERRYCEILLAERCA